MKLAHSDRMRLGRQAGRPLGTEQVRGGVIESVLVHIKTASSFAYHSSEWGWTSCSPESAQCGRGRGHHVHAGRGRVVGWPRTRVVHGAGHADSGCGGGSGRVRHVVWAHARHPRVGPVHLLQGLQHIGHGSEGVVLLPGFGGELPIAGLDVFLLHWDGARRLKEKTKEKKSIIRLAG